MDRVRLLRELESYPLFTLGDLAKVTLKSPAYNRLLLHRLVGNGLVFRIERGKYTAHEDPLVYGSRMVSPSYFSLWTSLRYYNLTTQLPVVTMVMASKSRGDVAVGEGRIVFTKTRHMWGYGKVVYGGFEVFMADREKTVVDGLLSMKLPVDEVNNAVVECEAEKLVGYALRTGKRSLMKRVGYLMERGGMKADLLLEGVDGNYVPLDGSRPADGVRDRRWKVIVNTVLE